MIKIISGDGFGDQVHICVWFLPLDRNNLRTREPLPVDLDEVGVCGSKERDKVDEVGRDIYTLDSIHFQGYDRRRQQILEGRIAIWEPARMSVVELCHKII